MKRLVLLVAFLSFFLWPVNYFRANPDLRLTPQTIFVPDYQGRQLILRNINLYPSVWLARMFQNKVVVTVNKYFDDLFELIDPNYYFFGSHPREVVGGQNYTRLPVLTIVPILWFLFRVKFPKKKMFLLFFTFLILTLSFFTNHHVYDPFLWVFFIPMIYFGLMDFYQKYQKPGTFFLFLLMIEVIYEYSLIPI